MTPYSRRAFLTTSSVALAGTSLGLSRSGLSEGSRHIPLRSRQPVATFFPESISPDVLRQLAMTGLDAARQAGASYADIRVSDSRTFEMYLTEQIPVPGSEMDFGYAYGLRVLVNGTWGFTFGVDPTPEGLARAARTAVTTAKRVAQFTTPVPAMAQAPVVQGEWATPVEIDPFGVSPDEHGKMLGAYIDAAKHAADGGIYGLARFRWTAETRVFASTEGTLLTQRLARAAPEIQARGSSPIRPMVHLPIPGFMPASAGFEIAVGTELQEHIKQAADEAARLAAYPVGHAEVGRYEAVFDGTALGAVCLGTLGKALELQRVLGEDADGAGTSMLAPVDDVLGQPLFSPVLTVMAERAMPMYGAAKWDDEGVTTETFPVIQHGQVVDYFATRATLPMLASSYGKRGKPLRVHGTAVAWTPTTSPRGCAAQLSITPGPDVPTLDAMIAQLQNGILVRGVYDDYSPVNTDSQLAGGAFMPGMLYEVKRGQIIRALKGGMIQFNTKRLWNAITTLGGRETVLPAVRTEWLGETWARATVPVSAPAAHLRQIEIIQIGRRY